jgi:hypothetical protein
VTLTWTGEVIPGRGGRARWNPQAHLPTARAKPHGLLQLEVRQEAPQAYAEAIIDADSY